MGKASNILKRIGRVLTDSGYRTLLLRARGMYDKLPDEAYLKKIYRASMGYALDLEDPKSFNEKLQWLKLYNRRPEYTVLVDKLLVRDYIAQRLGEEYLIPLLGVWEDPDQIDFDQLPDSFVLKCNHNSGLGMCICKDKSQLDIAKTRQELRKGIAQDYYLRSREWPYKHVPRRIIAEKFMVDSSTAELRDYKFFCFDGDVDCVMLCMERGTGDTKYYFFDRAWNLLRYNKRGLAAPEGFTVPKPDNMDQMFDIAQKLSKGMPFARIDLYSVEGKTYFGEITLFPDSGLDRNILPEMDRYWGERIKLPAKTVTD